MNILKKIINKLTQRKKTKMEQEIFEQPDIIFELIRKYVNKDYSINIELPDNIKNIVFIASGSSYHSASIITSFIRNKSNIEAQAYYASEILLLENLNINNDTLYVFISQSGETADTNSALDIIKQKTEKTLSVTNVKNSKLWQNSKFKILTYAGNEKSIVATKTMSSQLFCLFLIVVKILSQKNYSSMKLLDELLNVPEYLKNALVNIEQTNKYANIIANYDNIAILASGMFYPLAKEGALKIKETSYINTTAYPTGEFLHGHIAVLNKKCAVIILVNNQNIQVSIDLLMKLNKSYKTDIIFISSFSSKDIENNEFIEAGSKSEIDYLFSSLVILQLLAFKSAILLDRNVDLPQGLTKIVK